MCKLNSTLLKLTTIVNTNITLINKFKLINGRLKILNKNDVIRILTFDCCNYDASLKKGSAWK